MDYTITLTEAEQKAMEYIAADVDFWITNAAKNRARIAIDEICDAYRKGRIKDEERFHTLQWMQKTVFKKA